MGGFSSLVARFKRDERGVFAVIFAMMALVLVALAGAVVDYVSMEQTRNRSQIALDAAALALQPEISQANIDQAEIQKRAQALVDNRVGQTGLVKIDKTTIDLKEGSLAFSAGMTVNTAFVSLVGVKSLSARIDSEVKRGSMDVEVAVAVDITGSMQDTVPKGGGGSEAKIVALKRALGQLIDLVVKDDQVPSYSKMAVIPYSMGVNVGGYADAIRGAVRMPTTITNIDWASSTAKTITAATKANPVVITSAAHGFANGDTVYISAATGMTQVNNRIYTVANVSANTFQIAGVDGRSYGTYTSNKGRVTRCLVTTCELVVASASHGLSQGDEVHIYDVSTSGGMKTYSATGAYDSYNQYPSADSTAYNWINNNQMGYKFPNWPRYDSDVREYKFLVWDVGAVAANTFVLAGTSRTNGKTYGTYTSGGKAACVSAGCQFYLYQDPSSDYDSWRLNQISTCATERVTNGLNDASVVTTPLGRNYSNIVNPCPSIMLQPLTSNKTVLHDLADGLTTGGSTAGHLGLGWGWYMVSPNFDGPWPTASQPAPKTEKNVIRAVVLMTDGAFNTSYCNGVISQISGNGSGYNESKINCDSANGDSFDQAEALCAAMKKANPAIRVYTVAFDVGSIQSAKDIMANCASDPSYAFEATSGADLSAAFAKIGENLAYLRVSR